MWQHAQTLNLRGLGYATIGYFEFSKLTDCFWWLMRPLYIKINYSCVSVRPSVRPSVTGDQWKRFDLETQDAVSPAVELQS